MKRSTRPLLLAALVLVVSGCSVTNQQTTQLQYVPSDGEVVRFDGGLGVFSLVLVAESAQTPGTLVARVVNPTDEPQTVAMEGTGAAVFSAEVVVDPNTTLEVGPEGEQVVVEPAGEVPGRTVPVTVTFGAESTSVQVPVLDGTLQEYADLVPQESATS